MGVFNDDRATFNSAALQVDKRLSECGIDEVLHEGFKAGLDLDDLMYILMSHTERTVRRYIVQDQLRKAANKDKTQ